MNTRLISATAVSLIIGAALAALGIKAGSSPNDTAAIQALEETYRKGFEAKDVNAVMAVYAHGDQLFVFDAIPPRQYPSWDAYKKDWEGLFAMFPGPIKDNISDLDVHVAGNVAYSHHIEDTHFTKSDGSDQELVVRVTDIYRKINGKWLIVHEHVSFPVDVASGRADLLSKP
jgi:ketosteroid isomerase-like protein